MVIFYAFCVDLTVLHSQWFPVVLLGLFVQWAGPLCLITSWNHLTYSISFSLCLNFTFVCVSRHLHIFFLSLLCTLIPSFRMSRHTLWPSQWQLSARSLHVSMYVSVTNNSYIHPYLFVCVLPKHSPDYVTESSGATPCSKMVTILESLEASLRKVVFINTVVTKHSFDL